jgi:hypothetical protein
VPLQKKKAKTTPELAVPYTASKFHASRAVVMHLTSATGPVFPQLTSHLLTWITKVLQQSSLEAAR